MAPVVSCPYCGHEGRVPAEYAGRAVKCLNCARAFTASGPIPTRGPSAEGERPLYHHRAFGAPAASAQAGRLTCPVCADSYEVEGRGVVTCRTCGELCRIV